MRSEISLISICLLALPVKMTTEATMIMRGVLFSSELKNESNKGISCTFTDIYMM